MTTVTGTDENTESAVSAASRNRYFCRNCDVWIGERLPSARWCSDACRALGWAELRREERTAARKPRPCGTCGEVFTPARSDGRYCLPACRQKAYRRRQNGGAP